MCFCFLSIFLKNFVQSLVILQFYYKSVYLYVFIFHAQQKLQITMLQHLGITQPYSFQQPIFPLKITHSNREVVYQRTELTS